MDYGTIWLEAWVWANDSINMQARPHDKPNSLSYFERFFQRAPPRRLLPFMMPGTHHVKRATKMDPKAEHCFYLNSGSDHSSNCCKILLSSGVASYSADVVWRYRRVPFVGEIAT